MLTRRNALVLKNPTNPPACPNEDDTAPLFEQLVMVMFRSELLLVRPTSPPANPIPVLSLDDTAPRVLAAREENRCGSIATDQPDEAARALPQCRHRASVHAVLDDQRPAREAAHVPHEPAGVRPGHHGRVTHHAGDTGRAQHACGERARHRPVERARAVDVQVLHHRAAAERTKQPRAPRRAVHGDVPDRVPVPLERPREGRARAVCRRAHGRDHHPLVEADVCQQRRRPHEGPLGHLVSKVEELVDVCHVEHLCAPSAGTAAAQCPRDNRTSRETAAQSFHSASRFFFLLSFSTTTKKKEGRKE